MAKTTRQSKPKSEKSKPAGNGDGKNLVVVESPAKAKTINRYLGSDYIVKASMGHVRDLPKRSLGVDVENGFQPSYEAVTGRKKVLTELKKYAKGSGEVFLATDLDREGEAIAWHLAEALKVSDNRLHRVVFNEITKSAIRAAFENARHIDMDKVNAQQARRILDRLVGYEVSPLLWKKVARGLSAGRVQSVAVRLIVEREREIEAFTPEEYWRINAVMTSQCEQAPELAQQWKQFLAQRDERDRGPTQAKQQKFLAEHDTFRAELSRFNGEKFRPENSEGAIAVLEALGVNIDDVRKTENPDGKGPAKNLVEIDVTPDFSKPLKVSTLKHKDRKSKPPAPFTTSTVQQAASVQLYFSASRTMRLAQQLYEGIDVPGEGSVGLITYMRTDSRHLSREAVNLCRETVSELYGEQYVPEKPNFFTSGKRAQEAHEAIRPTDVRRTPQKLQGCLNNDQYKLYNLIWKRFLACQMPPAIWTITEATIPAETPKGLAEFRALGRTLKFDGFMRVTGVPHGGDQILPKLEEEKPVAPVEISPAQHFTQPPPRYTEASLVKALEADGIGRPSTYASIIKTIQDRKYVEQMERSFRPTDMGLVVTDKLVKHFPKIFDVHFTARMEDLLDQIEDGNADWVRVLSEFYGPFHQNLEKAMENMVHAKAEEQPSDYTCEKCGSPMVYKFARNGRYLACSGYPDCKNTHPVDRDGKKITNPLVDVACPKCGSALVRRKGRFGPFLSCSAYPECKGVVNLDKKGNIKPPSAPPLQVDLPCPKCEAPLNMRRSKRGPWLSCSRYPKCRGREGFKKLDEEKQKELEQKLSKHEEEHPQPQIRTLKGEPLTREDAPRELTAEEIEKYQPEESA